MTRPELRYLQTLQQLETKREQVQDLRREYIDNTSLLSKGTIKGGSDLVQGGFDSSHFPLELVQNADDEGASNLRIEVDDEEIRFFDDGTGFNLKGIVSVCQQGRSTKRATDQIGFMGIGFKSLFEVCDAVEIHSNGYHLGFGTDENADGLPGQLVPRWVEDSGNTTPHTPIGEDGTCYETAIVGRVSDPGAIRAALEPSHFASSIFLFIDNLETIRIRGEGHASGLTRDIRGRLIDNPESVERAKQRYLTQDGVDVARMYEDDLEPVETKEIQSGGETRRWVLFRALEVIPDDIQRPMLREGIERRQLFTALPLDSEGQLSAVPNAGSVRISPVHSYLPLKQLDDVDIDYIIHADFELDTTRTRIQSKSSWNEHMAAALRQRVLEPLIKTVANHESWYRNLELLIPQSRASDDAIIGGLLKELGKEARWWQIISIEGRDELVSPEEAEPVSDAVRRLFDPGEVHSVLGAWPVGPDQEEVLARLRGNRSRRALVDLLIEDDIRTVLESHLGHTDTVEWFTMMYRGIADEHESDGTRWNHRSIFAKRIFLTQQNRLVRGRSDSSDDTWEAFLPPRDGFDDVSEDRVSELGGFEIVHTDVLDDDLRELFERYGAEEASAIDVLRAEVESNGPRALSDSDLKLAIRILSKEAEAPLDSWLDALDYGDFSRRSVRGLVTVLLTVDAIELSAEWIVSHWEQLSDEMRIDSLRYLRLIYDDVDTDLSFLTVPNRDGDWVRPNRLVLSNAYTPEFDFERLSEEYEEAFRTLQLEFVDPTMQSSIDERGWSGFLEELGVGEKVGRLVGEIGELYVQREVLNPQFERVEGESGFDAIRDSADFVSANGNVRVEVKSTRQSNHEEIELKKAQIGRILDTEADEEYIVIPIVNALDAPRVHPKQYRGPELLRMIKRVYIDIPAQ